MELLKKISSMDSVCNATKSMVYEGKGQGLTIINVFNGIYNAEIICDKCLDIFKLSYKGKNIEYVTKNGLVSNKLAHSNSFPFGSSFPAGFLYTCGLDNVGVAKDIKGVHRVQHGSIGTIPSQVTNIIKEFNDKGEYQIKIEGIMKFTALFGENVDFKRQIIFTYNSNIIEINDEIVNNDFSELDFVLMYHFNLGYPIINNGTKILIDSKKVKNLDGSQKFVDTASEFFEPSLKKPEQVFVYCLEQKQQNIQVINKDEKLKVEFDFDGEQLPYLNEWKSEAYGDYVLGIEPCVTPMLFDKMEKLAGQSSKNINIKIKVSDI